MRVTASSAAPGAPTDALSLAELERFDPAAPARAGQAERRFLCPLPACAGKRPDKSHRSLAVNTHTGEWHCHRCEGRGKLLEWWEDRRPLNRQARARRALRAAAMPTPDRHCLAPNNRPQERPPSAWRQQLQDIQPLDGTRAAAYLEARGILVDQAHAAGARYCRRFYGRPAVVFPLRGADGRLVATQGRHTDGREDPKAHSAGPISAGVFATPGALAAAVVCITEAPIDALTLASAGLAAIALCGCALREWLPPALAGRRVLLAFDADQKGDEATAEWAGLLRRHGVRCERLRPAGAKDWNALLQLRGVDELRAGLAAVVASGRDVEATAPVVHPTAAATEPDPEPADAIALDVVHQLVCEWRTPSGLALILELAAKHGVDADRARAALLQLARQGQIRAVPGRRYGPLQASEAAA